jgi:hypothetical protein
MVDDAELLDCKLHGLRSWQDYFYQMTENAKEDFDPVLVLLENNLEKREALIDIIKSQEDCLYVKLGLSCPMAYIKVELLMALDKKMPSKIKHNYTRRYITNDGSTLSKLVKRIKSMPFKPVIVIDNCQYFVTGHIFKVLRLINELEGSAIFIFLAKANHLAVWKKERGRIQELEYFFKVVGQIHLFNK